MSQYIGKTISLVSVGDIRYVGILQNISAEDSTVALTHVWSFGTEGRRGGVNEIPPAPQMFEHIVFRGSDVKDLQVIDNPYGAAAAQPPQPAAQAPVQAQAPPQSQPAAPAPAQPAQPTQPAAQPAAQAPAPAPAATQKPAQPKARKQAPEPAAPEASQAGEELDFDFGSQEQFEQAQRERSQGDAKYNKSSSFFDSLSAMDDGTTPSERRQNDRNLNMETFGQAMPSRRGGRGNYRGRGRGNGRGNGRGGRGRGRGRGDHSNSGSTAPRGDGFFN